MAKKNCLHKNLLTTTTTLDTDYYKGLYFVCTCKDCKMLIGSAYTDNELRVLVKIARNKAKLAMNQ